MYSLPLVVEMRLHLTVRVVLGIWVALPKKPSPWRLNPWYRGNLLHPRVLDLRLGLAQANTWNPNVNFLGLGMPGLVVSDQSVIQPFLRQWQNLSFLTTKILFHLFQVGTTIFTDTSTQGGRSYGGIPDFGNLVTNRPQALYQLFGTQGGVSGSAWLGLSPTGPPGHYCYYQQQGDSVLLPTSSSSGHHFQVDMQYHCGCSSYQESP